MLGREVTRATVILGMRGVPSARRKATGIISGMSFLGAPKGAGRRVRAAVGSIYMRLIFGNQKVNCHLIKAMSLITTRQIVASATRAKALSESRLEAGLARQHQQQRLELDLITQANVCPVESLPDLQR